MAIPMQLFPLRRLLWMGLLASAVGWAQTSLTLTLGGAERKVVGPADCRTRFPLAWTFVSASQVCPDGLEVWASTEACSEAMPEGATSLFSLTATQLLLGSGTQNATVAFQEWPGFGEERPCGADNLRVAHNICGLVFLADAYGGCGSQIRAPVRATLPVIYKTTRPPAPTLESASGYDGQATFQFSTAGEDLKEVVLSGGRADGTGEVVSATAAPSVGHIRVSGLEDGVPYVFHLKSIDEVDNESESSAPIDITTVPTEGFWERYKRNGGEGGGCHATGGAPLWLSALALLYAARRPC